MDRINHLYFCRRYTSFDGGSETGAVVQEKEMNVLSILLSKEQPLKQVIKKLVEADVEIEDIEKEVVSIESIYSSIYGG